MSSSFIQNIKSKMASFGLDLLAAEASGGIYRMFLHDRVNDLNYIGIAAQSGSKNPDEHWSYVLDNVVPELQDAAGADIPFVMIFPTAEADNVYNAANNRGATPSTYKLLPEHSITAFTISDVTAMKGKPAAPDKSSKDKLPEPAKASAPKFKARYILPMLGLLLLLGGGYFAVKSLRSSGIFTFPRVSNVQTVQAPQTPEAIQKGEEPKPDEIPEDKLQKMADSTDANERALVAGHMELPESIIEQLSRDSDRRVREALGGNPAVAEYLAVPESEDMPEIKDFPQISAEKMQSFHNDASQIVEDPDLMQELEEAGAEWHIILRQRINSSFRKNVFDPLELVVTVLNEARGYENTIDDPESFSLFIEDEAIPDNVKDYVTRVTRFADNIVSGVEDELTPSVEDVLGE